MRVGVAGRNLEGGLIVLQGRPEIVCLLGRSSKGHMVGRRLGAQSGRERRESEHHFQGKLQHEMRDSMVDLEW